MYVTVAGEFDVNTPVTNAYLSAACGNSLPGWPCDKPLDELRSAARVAADKVRQTSSPYHFAPMSSRERRIVHLALRDSADLRTESEGEGLRRYVVVYPKDYKSAS